MCTDNSRIFLGFARSMLFGKQKKSILLIIILFFVLDDRVDAYGFTLALNSPFYSFSGCYKVFVCVCYKVFELEMKFVLKYIYLEILFGKQVSSGIW